MPLLKAQDAIKPVQFLQFGPIMLVFVLSYETSFLLAFMLGGLYLLWLARSVYALRQQRGRFRWELSLLVTIFILAVLVLFLGLLFPLVSQRLFFTFYTCAIGLAFLFIHIVLASTPQLSIEVVEAARETYAKSTLTNIDTDQCLQKLNTLMQERKLFQENNLDLFTLATELELSSHQLSELMNSCLGKSFSRYIPEQRVEAAKKRLHEAPKMSVLSVGLSVGFTSQSNFYEAFREIVGTSPAKYRKL